MTAQAAVSTQLVSEGPRVTQVRIVVGARSWTRSRRRTASSRALRAGMPEAGSMRGGVEQRGQPELPITGFPLALPLDLVTATHGPSITVKPEGPLRRLRTRLYPVQPSGPRTAGPQAARFPVRPGALPEGPANPASLPRNSLFRGRRQHRQLQLHALWLRPGHRAELTWYDSYLVQVDHAAGLLPDRPPGHLAGAGALATQRRRGRCKRPHPVLKYALNQAQLKLSCGP